MSLAFPGRPDLASPVSIARLVLAAAMLALPLAASAQDANCRLTARRVGACFTVHGRLFFSSTAPEIRLWPVGTHRILGVLSWDGQEDQALSEQMLERLWGGRDLPGRIWGDYEVCPLTADQAGRMQMVCLVNANKLFVERPQIDAGPAEAAVPKPDSPAEAPK